MDSATFLKNIRSKMEILDLEDSFIRRSLNDGFSGGEKKRNIIYPWDCNWILE